MKKESFIHQFEVNGKKYHMFNIKHLGNIERLPYSIRILVENVLRKMDGKVVTEKDLVQIFNWKKKYDEPLDIPYHPARVLMQDFTGVPAVVDLAAMRDAVEKLGGDPKKVNPLVPVELVIDHSVQIDHYGTKDAESKNVSMEYERNSERYAFLKWAQKSFDNFKVVPPGAGICHQVNLEHLGRVVMEDEIDGKTIAYPDTLVGLDSHTTMIDALGVLGWGVGGIEAEAVMLGQPYSLSIPEVIGVHLKGKLLKGVTATDMVLTITEMLREYGVVEKFVEFFGDGMKNLSIPDRATIANMSPEYGATVGFFPVDEKTIEYLRETNRKDKADLSLAYAKANGLFYDGEEQIEYTDILELDLSTVKPCISGPSKPNQKIFLQDMTKAFESKVDNVKLDLDGKDIEIKDGSIVIASITSCTNTSNPSVMIGAGLLAKKAVELGLKVPDYVKTSLAPGSKVVMSYLDKAQLTESLEKLGFNLVGFGCATCIGNSGPLHPAIEKTIKDNNLNVAAVLSGNRNFEARIHQVIQSNYLASPMLVVAYALAGRVDFDITKEPIGKGADGSDVYLKDLWPEDSEIADLVKSSLKEEFFSSEYGKVFDGDKLWKELPDVSSLTYVWDEKSTYIKNPPYFEGFSMDVTPPKDVNDANALVVLGDGTTTDHISPAGAIPEEYPAGKYLISQGQTVEKFNSYGSRRGNHEVMMRGTFGNVRLKNKLVGGEKEGSYTVKFPEKTESYIYDASMAYKDDKKELVVLAGKEYGTGSSRDWAAKGSFLLGVKAVIADSFERIHRSNLVGMGVLPLVFKEGENVDKKGLTGFETFSIEGIEDITPRKEMTVKAVKENGETTEFKVITRLDTEMEVDYFKNGGILPYVLRKMI
ncbi:MAG: aconitate hydratase AcnA [Deltaproteobacteria bacterium]|nr:aconitate hydratase AcnA [Deltaproteobacteria bacterium]